MKCSMCLQEDTVLIGGKCERCYPQNTCYKMPYEEFKYGCPQCGGKFNVPVMDGVAGYLCPFCGKEMIGLKII